MRKCSRAFVVVALMCFALTGCRKETPAPRNAFASLDLAIANVMAKYNVPAVSIAITRYEKLVYAQSLGFADPGIQERASNDNLYRVASVSKPITAIAILTLVNNGMMTLDQTVFGPGSILEGDFGIPPVDSKKDQITVRHLMNHMSGWVNDPDDPMFANTEYSKSEIITDMLLHRPLVADPGDSVYYLNFGYCVLGRVIEKVTGMTYEDYVQSSVLAQCGITGMSIGGSAVADRLPNEVIYFQEEHDPYSLQLERMDAAGGWVASGTDLARLLTHIDRRTIVTDLVPDSLLIQFYFGNSEWMHTGSMSGTSALFCRLSESVNFVLVANRRSYPDYGAVLNDMNMVMRKEIQLIKEWPEEDLF